jgi:hypothetical protein
VYDQFNLKDHGDATEQVGAREHDLDQRFPNYVAFWRTHVVPSTSRPSGIRFRRGVAGEVHQLAQVSHSIFTDIVDAADSLMLIRNGDLGAPGFRNCMTCIKSSGDGLQKFTELQKVAEKIGRKVGRSVELWTAKQWQSFWNPKREKIIGYRNYLTHKGQPQIMLVQSSAGETIPLVLKRKYVTRHKDLTWVKQQAVYQHNPSRWAPLPDVCIDLYDETLRWLDAAYGKLVKALARLLQEPDYQGLWGWHPTQGPRVAPAAMLTSLQSVSASGVTIVQRFSSNQSSG